ncbi:unnamed protein product [Symbiodinium sp. CCMP2456]|nr:unnamed protein product [Symbiodinium sp. CCMP2456]
MSFFMSDRLAWAVKNEMELQRRVCAERPFSAEKLNTQHFEARFADQAKEEAKKAEADAQRHLEECQARAKAGEEALSRAEASGKRVEQLLQESQAEVTRMHKDHEECQARAQAAEEALRPDASAKKTEQLFVETQAKVKKAEAKETEASLHSETATWGSWRYFVAVPFLLLCFWEFAPRCFGRSLASFLCPARNYAFGTEASLKRRMDAQDKAVKQLKEDVDAIKDQLCRSKQQIPISGMRQQLMAAVDSDQGVRQSSEPIAMQQSETCSEVWSHTSWLEISEREEFETNSLSKISAGGTDSPEPCCYLQESLFLAEDKGKYIPGFALYEGCKISAADGTVIRVPELHRAEKTLILRAGSAVLQVTPDHRIPLPTGDTVPADMLRIGQEVMVQNTPTQLTSVELSSVPVNVLKLAFDPDLPVEVLVPLPAIQSKVKRACEEGAPAQLGAPFPGGFQHPRHGDGLPGLSLTR